MLDSEAWRRGDRATRDGRLARVAQDGQAAHRGQVRCNPRNAGHVRSEETARRASALLGVEPITASAVVASVDDFSQFANARQFGAWLGHRAHRARVLLDAIGQPARDDDWTL